MKHTSILLSLALAAIAGCGGKSKATVGSTAGGSSAALIPVGIHQCHFVLDKETYGAHRCDVVAGTPVQLQKLSGMEIFSGTIAAVADGLQLTAEIGDGPMVANAHQAFTVDLHKDGAGWTGTVTPKDGSPSWWLAGSTFEVDDAPGYGGATYGDAWPQPDGE